MSKLADKIKADVKTKTPKASDIKVAVAKKIVKAATVVAVLLSLAVSAGCASQPSRAQNASIKADTISIVDGRAQALASLIAYIASNNVPAETALALLESYKSASASGDFSLITQAMAIETGGNEANTQTSTPTTTTPIDLSYGGGAVNGVDSLLGAAANRISGKGSALKKQAGAKPAADPASPCGDGGCSVQ